ncbi:uncharacterized protein C8orf34 homolog isoform X1 [Mytilus trossulus]|uniref:uncharacterized protein C8orf34 homolog isoform X1 n=1 Tax=Mytilus trossulus TaxID=6551 RepID=UPI0030047305
MGTPQRIQTYMEKHRLTPLFEEMMNKVLHEQPEDPYLYLIKVLYRKAGLDIPADIRLGAVRKSSPERLGRRTKSPEPSRKSNTWAASGTDDRGYNKPWLTHSKKPKPKSPDEPEHARPAVTSPKSNRVHSARPHTAQTSSSPRSQAQQTLASPRSHVKQTHSSPRTMSESLPLSFDDLLKVTPISPGRRQKQGWNADNKVAATSFDDLFEGQTKSEESKGHRRTETSKDTRTAWASSGLGDDDIFRSSNYKGPRPSRTEEDPLAGELMNCKETVKQNTNADMNSTGHVRGPKIESKKHRQELNQYLQEKDKHSDDSGYLDEQEEEDDAIELLEDADDLRREGVTNIPKSGYKLSKILRQRHEDANVKLNINLNYADIRPQYSFTDDRYNRQPNNGSPYDSDPDERPNTGMSGYQPSPGDSEDDEFESVSQVTGPRRPVWNVMDSDGETYNPKMSRTLPEPTRSRKSNSQSRKLAATVPVRFDDTPYPSRSVESADSFLQGRETWSGRTTEPQDEEVTVRGSVRSESGGWQLPRYESDTSLAEWQYEGKLKKNPPPKAY